MKLYPHNQKAYEAVIKHFQDGHRKAAVIQSTGTGKSYVGGAVASHFKKVLVVAPNDYVIEQATSTAPHADSATYSFLSINESIPTGYDLIWFDEFHRIGAPTWMGGVEKVIEANPQAKILGTTATPDRALEQRNMAEEFFDGDVVSYMSLTDAWLDKILRVPIYVTGVVSMASTQADYKNRIKASKRLAVSQKREATALLDNIVRDWSYSYGVPQILKKYIDKDVERMIVFAQTINKLDEVCSSIRPWFKEAGIKLANVYSVHSGMGADAKVQMKAFEDDNNDGVKVLVCVDMLNEGIHVDRVDAVMLLRSTISKNLYMQQIGRCFSVGQKHQPIILDLADNLSSACGYEGIYDAQSKYLERAKTDEPSNRTPDEFMVIDTLKDARELIAEIDKQVSAKESGYWTFERCREEALKYNRRVDFNNGSKGAYQKACKEGWIDEICSHMIMATKKKGFWNDKDNCIEEALKYSTRWDFKVNSCAAYNSCCVHGWLDEVCAHMDSKQVPKGYWTYDKCMQEASLYEYRVDFAKKSRSAYATACSNGWLKDCCKHMKLKSHKWTIEEIESLAKQCNTKKEWRERFKTSYSKAGEMGILNDICDRFGLVYKKSKNEI